MNLKPIVVHLNIVKRIPIKRSYSAAQRRISSMTLDLMEKKCSCGALCPKQVEEAGKTVCLARSLLNKTLIVSLGLLGTSARQDVEVACIKISAASIIYPILENIRATKLKLLFLLPSLSRYVSMRASAST